MEDKVLSASGVTFLKALDFLYWARFINYVCVGDSIEFRPLFVDQYEEGCADFPNMSAISIFLEPGRMAKFHIEDPQILGVTLQNCRPATMDLYTLE